MGVLFDVTPVERALDRLLAYTYPRVDITPTILISNLTSRAQRVDEYAKLLNEVDETHSAIARLEAQLAEVNLRLRQRRATVATVLVPVAGLPTEMLREIFLLVAENTRTSKARIRLSHVSSGWRAVSLGLKELWTVIQVPQNCPDMVHEFAARSGNLRLQLHRLPDNDWPADLELTFDEAARLSTMSTMSAPSHGTDMVFERSLMQQSPLIRLDELLMSGPNQRILGGMARAKSLRVSDSTIHHNLSIRMERLVNLFVDNILDTDLSGIMGSLQAPLLRHMAFSRIWISREPHRFPPQKGWSYIEMLEANDMTEEDDDGFGIFERELVTDLTRPFSHGKVASQITSLVIDECHCGFMIPIFVGWRMSNLVSLVLVLSADPAANQFAVQFWRTREVAEKTTSDLPRYIRYLPEFLSHTPLLETLDLSIDTDGCSLIAPIFGTEDYDGECLLPNLKTLYLRDLDGDSDSDSDSNSESDSEGPEDSAEIGLLEHIQARSRVPGVEQLQDLSVSTNFVKESEIEGLRGCVDLLTLLDD